MVIIIVSSSSNSSSSSSSSSFPSPPPARAHDRLPNREPVRTPPSPAPFARRYFWLQLTKRQANRPALPEDHPPGSRSRGPQKAPGTPESYPQGSPTTSETSGPRQFLPRGRRAGFREGMGGGAQGRHPGPPLRPGRAQFPHEDDPCQDLLTQHLWGIPCGRENSTPFRLRFRSSQTL